MLVISSSKASSALFRSDMSRVIFANPFSRPASSLRAVMTTFAQKREPSRRNVQPSSSTHPSSATTWEAVGVGRGGLGGRRFCRFACRGAWGPVGVGASARPCAGVDISRELRRALLQLPDDRLVKAFAKGKSDISDELVFTSEAGTPNEMNNFSERVFKPLLSRAGLRRIRFHDLRHSHGSLLIQAGASLAYVRDQMAHSSIQVTVDLSGYLIPGANVAFVDKLDGQISGQQSATQPQQRARLESDGFKEVLGNEWLGGKDSNLRRLGGVSPSTAPG